MIKNILIFTLVLAASIALLSWSDKHDKQVELGAEKYEACVKQEYGVSPASYYANHGEYPTCTTTAQ